MSSMSRTPTFAAASVVVLPLRPRRGRSRARDQAHLQLLEDQFIAQGMSADDARYAAGARSAGSNRSKEHQRDTRSFRWLDGS